MATLSRQIFSGSTNGLGIKVAATSTPGTTIHDSDASAVDHVYLYAFNSHSSDVLLTIEFGGTTDPDNIIEQTIPSQDGLHLVIPGLPATGGIDIDAFAATTNVITIYGYVNRSS